MDETKTMVHSQRSFKMESLQTSAALVSVMTLALLPGASSFSFSRNMPIFHSAEIQKPFLQRPHQFSDLCFARPQAGNAASSSRTGRRRWHGDKDRSGAPGGVLFSTPAPIPAAPNADPYGIFKRMPENWFERAIYKYVTWRHDLRTQPGGEWPLFFSNPVNYVIFYIGFFFFNMWFQHQRDIIRRLGFVNYIKDIFRPGVDERYIVNEEKDLAKLHGYRCDNCGRTLYPAIGREHRFFKEDFKCPSCGADRDTFYDIYDPADPRNYENDEDVPPEILELWAKEEEEDLRAIGLDPSQVNLDSEVAAPAIAKASPVAEVPPKTEAAPENEAVSEPEPPIEEQLGEINDVDREALKNLLSDLDFKQTLEEEDKALPDGLPELVGMEEEQEPAPQPPMDYMASLSRPPPASVEKEEVKELASSTDSLSDDEEESGADLGVEETLIGAEEENPSDETILGAAPLASNAEESLEAAPKDPEEAGETIIRSTDNSSQDDDEEEFDILAL